MTDPLRPLRLRAYDPLTYRWFSIPLGSAWDAGSDPEVSARYIGNLAVTIAREWARRYSVVFPGHRIEWEIQ